MSVVSFDQVHGSDIPSYASLSWVWGSTRSFDGLTTAQFPQAHHENFLDALRLPLTVSDSITFLRQLGMRYLWVDMLCIIQDSSTDKGFFISLMGLIYSASEFTIIANGRMGALDGLPGTREGTTPKQKVLRYGGLCLVVGLDPKHDYREDEPSPWQSRAWTLQERLLSPRCLTFDSNQMHWECLEASYCEESAFETNFHGTSPSPIEEDIESLFSSDFKRGRTRNRDFELTYQHLFREYNSRQLTFDSDALNAIQGILHTLTDMTGVPFFWGLPCSHFEQHLMWQFQHNRRTRRKRDHQGLFPSWSWLNYQIPKDSMFWECKKSPASIRCYKKATDLPTNSDNSFIQPVTDREPFESNSNARYIYDFPSADQPGTARINRAVEDDDIPVAVRELIRPGFHIMFWAAAIYVESLMETTRNRGGEYRQEEYHNRICVVDRPGISKTRDLISMPNYDDASRVDWTGLKLQVVRVVVAPGDALLVVEDQGIAQRVGVVELSRSIDWRHWSRKLIILG
ncbi:MAG: hypothetical protein Q9169_007553 [Polycauliona sp. 2 TL-2023]